MKTLALVALCIVLIGCENTTAPEVDCQGELRVNIQVTRFGSDTTVVCAFPQDTLPPVEPPGDDCKHHHHHKHHRRH